MEIVSISLVSVPVRARDEEMRGLPRRARRREVVLPHPFSS